MELPGLTSVRGIGVDTARLLAEHGIGDVLSLAAASIDDIAAVPGFGPARAATVINTAAALLAEAEPEAVASDRQEAKKKKEKKDGKGKGDKKKDKKGKKKRKGGKKKKK